MVMLHISAHILDPFLKLRSSRKWDNGMDNNPEEESSYATKFQQELPKYVENQYCSKH